MQQIINALARLKFLGISAKCPNREYITICSVGDTTGAIKHSSYTFLLPITTRELHDIKTQIYITWTPVCAANISQLFPSLPRLGSHRQAVQEVPMKFEQHHSSPHQTKKHEVIVRKIIHTSPAPSAG